MSPTQEHQLERVVQLWSEHRCAEPGPYGAVCTDHRAHRYAHYDASKDTSWTDRWEEDFDVSDPGEHPVGEEEILTAIRAFQGGRPDQ